MTVTDSSSHDHCGPIPVGSLEAPPEEACSGAIPIMVPGTPPARPPSETDPHDDQASSTISVAQLEANRRNAQNSTGPRSAEGKKKSSLNAMRHGAYSQARAIPRGVLRESQDEVDDYIEAIVIALGPRDAPELVIARRIASADLRLARLERYECTALASVSRLRTDLHEVSDDLLEITRVWAYRFGDAALALQHRDEIEMDSGAWYEIASAIWQLHEVPWTEQVDPDVDHGFGEETSPEPEWRRFVLEDLIPKYWSSTAAAIGALDSAYRHWMSKYEEHEGKAEERAVLSALAQGGPIDAVSIMRARVQREGDRDRATYAELKKRSLPSGEAGRRGDDDDPR